MIDTRLADDAPWYQEQAERLRQKAQAVKDDDALRNSYLTLASEYERLAMTLTKRRPNFGAESEEGSGEIDGESIKSQQYPGHLS